MSNIKKAFVLAAGLGTRMRPITDTTPKPMIEVQGRAMIDRALDRLVEVGVEKAIVNTFYLPEIIENHLSKRSDIEIIFSREEERLETGGGIKNALHLLGDEPFYVTSSDVIWQSKESLESLAKNWNDDLFGLLLLHKTSDAYGYDGAGDFHLNASGELKFRSEDSADFVFTTLQILNPKLFTEDSIEELGDVFSMRAVYEMFLSKFRGIENQGDWFHIGTPEAINGLANRLK